MVVHPAEPGTVWEQVWASLPRLSLILAALGVLYSCLGFLTGGVRPQTQVDLDKLKDTVTNLQSSVAVCQSKQDAMPRSSDFEGWQGHFSRLDAVFESQREKVTQAQYDIKDIQAEIADLKARYLALTTTTPARK
jgi:peptidoglycan hydrolase CwlO-like protein